MHHLENGQVIKTVQIENTKDIDTVMPVYCLI